VAGTCEYGKKIFGFHKMQGISWLAARTGQLLKEDCAPWSKEVFRIFRTDAVKTIKFTITPIGRHHPRSSTLCSYKSCWIRFS
jgi:nicotinamide riboside kinase